jgi:predicted DNA-binding protein YlxM (UPF0122 family)
MNAREKQLIEGIISKDDRLRNRCLRLLLRGEVEEVKGGKDIIRNEPPKNPYHVTIKNAVRGCFADDIYKGRFPEIYDVFEQLFIAEQVLANTDPKKLREIDDLRKYLYSTVRNFCNEHRKKICDELSIELGYIYEAYDDNSIVDGEDNIELSDEINKEANTSSWAESFLGSLIDKIGNAYYRDLIRTFKIEEVPVKNLAKKHGKTEDDIYRDYNRAWNKLLQVALPEIRIRCKSLFKKYEFELIDEQACLLNEFFFSNKDLSTMAHSLGMKQDDLENALVKAHKVLVKIAKRETELDEKEKRKEAREQRRIEKEEAARKNVKNDRKDKFSNLEVIENL